MEFDFTLPTVLPDPTGTGASPFIDGFFVSVATGTDFFDLLLVDEFGPLPNPFGTAPGTVALGTPSDTNLDFGFSVDLSSQAGSAVTLFFDLIQEDDGLLFDPDLNNVTDSATATTKVIPELSAFSIWTLIGVT